MEHAMTAMQSFRNSFMSSIGRGRAPDLPALQAFCGTLLVDVPAAARDAMLQRLEKMRRADDVWHLRTALFDTISRAHGEAVARERLTVLDEQLP
jgi:hypothetical protein